jgi:hypothetical protein
LIISLDAMLLTGIAGTEPCTQMLIVQSLVSGKTFLKKEGEA